MLNFAFRDFASAFKDHRAADTGKKCAETNVRQLKLAFLDRCKRQDNVKVLVMLDALNAPHLPFTFMEFKIIDRVSTRFYQQFTIESIEWQGRTFNTLKFMQTLSSENSEFMPEVSLEGNIPYMSLRSIADVSDSAPDALRALETESQNLVPFFQLQAKHFNSLLRLQDLHGPQFRTYFYDIEHGKSVRVEEVRENRPILGQMHNYEENAVYCFQKQFAEFFDNLRKQVLQQLQS